MPTVLANHNCEIGYCLLAKRNSNYSVFGKAKGTKTNYKIANNSRFLIDKYIVDDCVLAHLEKDNKCDYLFVVERSDEVKDGYFVEMKGQDFVHACKQILSSIAELKNNINGAVFARIITTKFSVPNYQQNKEYRALKGKLGANFDHKNIVFEDIV